MTFYLMLKRIVKLTFLTALFIFLVILLGWWGFIVDICLLFYVLTKDGYYFWEG